MDDIAGRLVEKITGFLMNIGIDVELRSIEGDSFMPGVALENGVIIIDADKLCYPGDILHEAGHVATTPPHLRKTMNGNLPANDLNQGGEIMSQAWCYAACLHLGIDPAVVFHGEGYQGGGDVIVRNFNEGAEPGVPALQWLGMTYEKKHAAKLNTPAFPTMMRWVRLDQPR